MPNALAASCKVSNGMWFCLLLSGAHCAPSALYYKLSGADITSAAWPTSFLKYDVLIADPGLRANQLALVRRDLPGRKLVAWRNRVGSLLVPPARHL